MLQPSFPSQLLPPSPAKNVLHSLLKHRYDSYGTQQLEGRLPDLLPQALAHHLMTPAVRGQPYSDGRCSRASGQPSHAQALFASTLEKLRRSNSGSSSGGRKRSAIEQMIQLQAIGRRNWQQSRSRSIFRPTSDPAAEHSSAIELGYLRGAAGLSPGSGDIASDRITGQ